MTPLRNHIRLGAAALTLASAVLAANTSFAVPRYDGVWSVSIFTTRGDCIASYRYPMRIANGVLMNGGDIALNVSGRVAPSGAVRVSLSHGDTPAAAAGRLSRHFWQRLVERRILLGFLDRAAAQLLGKRHRAV